MYFICGADGCGFETNEDLKWHKNEQGRLCVRFNGLSEHTFQIYCDRRQLHWFQRFLGSPYKLIGLNLCSTLNVLVRYRITRFDSYRIGDWGNKG